MNNFTLGRSVIGPDCPTYFVADIAANHDKSLDRALELIDRCAEAGANAAKFQNFKASTIVSDHGFKNLTHLKSHQSEWKKSVYSIYDEASISLEWSSRLKEKCDNCGIDYFTAPYDIDFVSLLEPHVCAWKVGSGDITWLDLIDKLSRSEKPLLIATGASTIHDVRSALHVANKNTNKIVLMQCNTNYTGSPDNFKYINLNVLKSYCNEFPDYILGLSDHTPGHTTVLGAIALGARVIEKHFTDDTTRDGPDHKFSMDPSSWLEMIKRTRELEDSLGDGIKRVEHNERETWVLQRRSLRASEDLAAGSIITPDNLVPLRPCPEDGLMPSMYPDLVGKILVRDLVKGELVKASDLSQAT